MSARPLASARAPERPEAPRSVVLPTPPRAPRVRLLDARAAGVDEPGLRELARAECASSGAPHTTRSYSFPYALVAWHEARVGVDIERIAHCDEAFARSISTPAEHVEYGSVLDPDGHFTSVWSSKEALAKALGDALEYDPRRLDSPLGWPGGRAGAWRALALALPGAAHHVAWLCWRAA
jgi:hypothetical protein